MNAISDIFLDLNALPKYKLSNYRYFYMNEKHLTRNIPDSVLILMLGGVLRVYEEDRPLILTEGDYYIQRPHLWQRGIEGSDAPKYFYIHFLNANYTSSPNKNLPIKGKFIYKNLHDAIINLDYLQKSKTSNKVQKEAAFYHLISKLYEQSLNNSTYLSNARKIERYLSEHFVDKHPLADVSQQYYYTENYVVRLFKKAYGLTPHQYIISLRVEHAKFLLSTTQYTLEEIALACGYSDPSAFYRAFHSATQMTPHQWKINSI